MPAADVSSAAPDIRHAVGKATLIILSLTLVDKGLALAKEMLIAARFGISPVLDAFNLAFAVPGLLGLLIAGAAVEAFVPLYTDWKRDLGPEAVRDRTLTVFTGGTLASLLAAAAGYALAPLYFPLLGYGFDPARNALGLRLLQSLMLLVALEGISAFLAGQLRAWKAFAAVTAAQLPINLCLLLFLGLGRPGDIQLLVQGTLVGTALKTLWLLLAVGGKLRLFAPFHFEPGALAAFSALALPLLGGDLIANANLLVDQSMATQLASGGVSTLRYAYRINDLPLQLIVIAISKAILPFLSDQASAGDMAGMRRLFGQTLASLGLVVFPAMAFVLLFADDIVAVLLRRGAFDAEAARRTALTLRYYTAGLLFFAYAYVNSAFFCALKRTRPLFTLGIFSLFANIGLNVVFLRLLDEAGGIALSTTVTGGLLAGLFVVLLRRLLQMDRPWRLIAGLVAPAGATAAAVLPCLACLGTGVAASWPPLLRLPLMAGLFLAVWIPAALLLLSRCAEEHQPIWRLPGLTRPRRRAQAVGNGKMPPPAS